MNYKKYVSGAVITAAFAALTVLVPMSANAATANVTAAIGGGQINPGGPMMRAGTGDGRMGMGWNGRGGMGSSTAMMARPAVVGKVSAINGTSLTVVQAARPSFSFGSTTVAATATTTFTVDASNATVFKNNATSSVSSIAVNDTVAVQGTVNGTNVAATTIRDGFEMRMGAGQRGGNNPHFGNQASSSNNMPPASPIMGNGQPVIAGTISAINGSSLTITNKSNVTYTVDASNAKIVEGQSTVAVSNLSVGDSVIIQGTVSGTSITASSVIDQKVPATGTGTSTPHKGILGSIGGFFMHIFGF